MLYVIAQRFALFYFNFYFPPQRRMFRVAAVRLSQPLRVQRYEEFMIYANIIEKIAPKSDFLAVCLV